MAANFDPTDATLFEIISWLLERDDAEDVRLEDNADTWTLDHLYDAILDAEDEYADECRYSYQGDAIYRIGEDRYLKEKIYQTRLISSP